MIVGPGVVLAASYEARAYGVRSAMGAAQARRRYERERTLLLERAAQC